MKYGLEIAIIIFCALLVIINVIRWNIDAALGWGTAVISQITIITLKFRLGE